MPSTTLRTTALGETGLEITRVGFGAWAIGGGGWEFGWGPQEDEQSLAAIERALALGVNWIDTAAAYGFGHSEEIVGRALRGRGEHPYVFTKCSLLEGPARRVVHSLKRDSVMREAHASLERLGIDQVPSSANFILAYFGDRAIEVRDALREQTILVRDRSYEIPGGVRITVGTRDQANRVLEALEKIW